MRKQYHIIGLQILRLVWRKTVLFMFLYCEHLSCRMQEQNRLLIMFLLSAFYTAVVNVFSFVPVMPLKPRNDISETDVNRSFGDFLYVPNCCGTSYLLIS